MDDNLEQLLKSLNLRRIGQVLDRELQRAVKKEISYEEPDSTGFCAWHDSIKIPRCCNPETVR